MIFWKYIKGLAQGGTIHETGTSTNAERYTYIEFQPENNVSGTFTNSPWIYFNNGAGTQNTSLGHIITQLATGQSIDTEFTFNNDVVLARGQVIKTSLGSIIKTYTDSPVLEIGNGNIINILGGTNLYGNLILPDDYHIYSNGYIESGSYITAAGNITAGDKCEAKYFNATSDRRAKTNIKSLDFDALDLIKKVQLYSFTYKDTDTKSIGVIAQDLQSISLDGFKLVDNEDASGKDMDYMTVHESKLVYILWKAIQEQQKEIEELKAKLK